MDSNRAAQGRGPGLYDEQLQRKVQEKRLKTQPLTDRPAFFAEEKR